MPLCDGCGTQVGEAHIRRRIERLELATRFRPIHIQALILDSAPPAEPEDYFYRAPGSAQRSGASQMFFDAITTSIGRKPGEVMSEESALAEFQRRGFFLAYAVECPVESPEGLPAAVARLASTVLLRLNGSYKPKFVAPISNALQPVIPLLQSNGWADRLILRDGLPFQYASSETPQPRAEFGAALADHLSKALAHHD